MYTVKATDKVKGVLDFPKVKFQLNKHEVRYLNEKEYWSSDVQTAIQLGFLKLESNDGAGTNPNATRTVKCKNIYNRPVMIACLGTAINPGSHFFLTEEQLGQDDIRKSIQVGMIKVVSVTGGKEEDEEGHISLGGEETDTEPETPEVPKKKVKKEPEGNLKIEMKPELETNAEIATPKKVVDNDNPPPITKEDVKDPKKKSVVWNPTNRPILNEMSEVETKEEFKEPKPDEDPRKSSLTWDFNNKKAKFVEPKNQEEKVIGFVDKEQEAKRIEEHPKLKDQPPQNQEVKFVE